MRALNLFVRCVAMRWKQFHRQLEESALTSIDLQRAKARKVPLD